MNNATPKAVSKLQAIEAKTDVSTLNRDDIEKTLKLFFEPGDLIEVRIIKHNGTLDHGYFTDWGMVLDELENYDDTRAEGVYFVLNKIDPAKIRKAVNVPLATAQRGQATSDTDIEQRRWLLIDVDPVRDSKVSATDVEHELAASKAKEVCAFLSNQGWPEPIRADSGNGAHLLYPIDLANDDEAKELVEGVLKALDREFSDTTVKIDTAVGNPARLCKLYGTRAQKGQHSLERPHRLAQLRKVPQTLEPVPLEALHELADLDQSFDESQKTERPQPQATSNQRSSTSSNIPTNVVEALRSKGSSEGQSGLWNCPVANHGQGRGDRTPSLSVRIADDGRVQVKCFAGCSRKAILDALGLEWSDPSSKKHKKERSTSPNPTAHLHTGPGLTLAQYAKAKQIPIDELKSHGLSDKPKYQGKPAVCIRYYNQEGQEAAKRFRCALNKDKNGVDNRFRWKTSDKALPYGLWKLQDAEQAGHIVLVEGESDCHTLWHHGIPALGIPGVNTWRDEWVSFLEQISKVYLVVEPDEAGRSLRDRLAESPLKDRLYLLDLAPYKDPSEIHLASAQGFVTTWEGHLSKAFSYDEVQEAEREKVRIEKWGQCKDLAVNPSILDEFLEDYKSTGAVSNGLGVKTTYLAVTSRMFQRPASLVYKGPSSSGKSYEVEQVLKFFPERAFYFLTSCSDKALVYLDESLSHRMLVIAEASGLQSESFDYMVRSLLSEGRLKHLTVEKNQKTGKQGTREVIKEGPTGLIITTTAVSLHKENETRLLSIPVDDGPEQTRKILDSIAMKACNGNAFGPNTPKRLEEWHALQDWIQLGPCEVAVPFAMELVAKIRESGVRLRRDVGQLMTLIQSHALLHQASRKIDRHGCIEATLSDYAAVRPLLAPLLAEGIGATVSVTIRETVAAVEALLKNAGTKSVTRAQVAKQLGLDPSAAYRRVKSALAKDYLVNDETKSRRPAKLVLGDPLPEEWELLPSAESIETSNWDDWRNYFDSWDDYAKWNDWDGGAGEINDTLSEAPGICSEINGSDGVSVESGEGSEAAA